MGFIYKIYTDIDNKVYIGKTTYNLQHRWKEHIRAYKNIKRDTYLYRAMRHYGEEHFKIELIEEVDNLLLNDREIYWIAYYDSFKNGYNGTLGGDGGKTMSTEYHRIVCGEPVLQYDLQGNLIREFISSGEASEITGTLQCEINRCCERSRNAYSANGYIWKRKSDNTPIEVWVKLNKSKFGRHPVKQYSLDGTFIARYDSIAEANRLCGFNSTSRQITMCCSGKNKTAYGYIWKYDDTYAPIDLDNPIEGQISMFDKE